MSDPYVEYVGLSARYCELLFASAREFFDANVNIEAVIADMESPNPVKMERAASGFTACASHARGALNYIEKYQYVHENYPRKLIQVDFLDQVERLKDIVKHSEKAASFAAAIKDSADVQDSIWKNP
ncbi:hypothetical protein, partial [Actinotignum sp. GS-2025a]